MAGKKHGSLRTSFMTMTLLPLFFLGVVMSVVTTYKVRDEIFDKMEIELRDTAYTIVNVYDRMYPGDYGIVQSDTMSAITKGKEYLARSAELLDNIKEDTGTDISFFYGDVRYVTTIRDETGISVVGTKINSIIANQVLKEDRAVFYRDVKVGTEKYVAYYMPLHNSDQSVVGMLAVLRKSATIHNMVRRSIVPMLIIFVVSIAVVGALTVVYARSILNALSRLKRFLVSVEKGELNHQLNETVSARDDEIGEMGRAAVAMQHSIRKLVERDALTNLYNRRYGEKRLAGDVSEASENSALSICIGDIDFFKKINDTYGHEAGDKVLISVAATLKSHMMHMGFVARWGGEEFLIVFENTELATARESLCELLDKIHELEVESDGQIIKINMSFGVVKPNVAEGESGFDALKRADALLYYAKEHGRNQVVSSDDNLC